MGDKKPVKSAPAKAAPEKEKPIKAASAKPAAIQKPGKAVAAPVEEPKPEVKKKEKRSQKEKPKSKKKHKKVQVWKLYEIKDGKAKRKNELCPRCGPGTFLAVFRNRKYCGKCGWSQIQKSDDRK